MILFFRKLRWARPSAIHSLNQRKSSVGKKLDFLLKANTGQRDGSLSKAAFQYPLLIKKPSLQPLLIEHFKCFCLPHGFPIARQPSLGSEWEDNAWSHTPSSISIAVIKEGEALLGL